MRKRLAIKRLLLLIIIVSVLIGAAVLKHSYYNAKNSDLNYAARQYITTGIFNSYKLYKVNDIKISFSDGNMAVVTISGLLDKAPHDNVKYNIVLEKKPNGVWKVSKVYS